MINLDFDRAPELGELIRQILDGNGVIARRSKVPSLGKSGFARGESLCQHEIAAQRLEYVLPGTDRVRTTDNDGSVRDDATHKIGDNSIFRPVAATDNVAGARRSNQHARLPSEKGSPVSRGH